MEATTELKARLKAIAKRIVYTIAPPEKFHAKSKGKTTRSSLGATCAVGSFA